MNAEIEGEICEWKGGRKGWREGEREGVCNLMREKVLCSEEG
jgi:hypothetical protein